MVNHLKSRGSGTDADQVDGRGSSANRRELQVARLLDPVQNRIGVGRGLISVDDYDACPASRRSRRA